MYPQARSALTELDLMRLDQFLHSGACGREAMGLSRAHGFLTTGAAGPEALEAGEWIRLVFDEPVFNDGDEAREMLGIAVRLYQELERTLGEGGEFCPVLEYVRDTVGNNRMDARPWAQGFMSGINLFPEYWTVASRRALNSPLRVVTRLAAMAAEGDFLYQRLCDVLPASIAAMHRYWHASA